MKECASIVKRVVEDEFHFFMECPAYEDLRKSVLHPVVHQNKVLLKNKMYSILFCKVMMRIVSEHIVFSCTTVLQSEIVTLIIVLKWDHL